MGKTLAFPPDTPADVVAILMKAADGMYKDPQFLDEIEKIQPGSVHSLGEDLIQTFAKTMAAPPESIQWMRDMFSAKHGVSFG